MRIDYSINIFEFARSILKKWTFFNFETLNYYRTVHKTLFLTHFRYCPVILLSRALLAVQEKEGGVGGMTEEGCGNSAILTRIRTLNAPKIDIKVKKKF